MRAGARHLPRLPLRPELHAAGASGLAANILAAVATGTVLNLSIPHVDNIDTDPVTTYTDLSGLSNDMVQATSTKRPSLSSGAFGGTADGLLFNAAWAMNLATASLDLSSLDSVALISVFKDTVPNQACWMMLGSLASDHVYGWANHTTGSIEARAGTPAAWAKSAASYPMTDAGVVSVTWDGSLSASECEIRHDGSNVTNTRPSDGNTAPPMADGRLTIMADGQDGNALSGTMGPSVLIGWNGPLSDSEVAAVEALLSAALTAESWD